LYQQSCPRRHGHPKYTEQYDTAETTDNDQRRRRSRGKRRLLHRVTTSQQKFEHTQDTSQAVNSSGDSVDGTVERDAKRLVLPCQKSRNFLFLEQKRCSFVTHSKANRTRSKSVAKGRVDGSPPCFGLLGCLVLSFSVGTSSSTK
jgi:hypothetical protein